MKTKAILIRTSNANERNVLEVIIKLEGMAQLI